MGKNTCVVPQKFYLYDKAVIASIPRNIDFVQYHRRTRKLIVLEYCLHPIICDIDAITDKYMLYVIYIVVLRFHAANYQCHLLLLQIMKFLHHGWGQ